MTVKIYPLFTFFLVSILFLVSVQAQAENREQVRKPAWAGKFYPADSHDLTKTIENLTNRVGRSATHLTRNKKLKALIMPHAGYMYSGLTAAYASLVLTPNQYKKVILIGPDHHFGVDCGAVSLNQAYQTPLGEVPVHSDARKLVSQSPLFRKASPRLNQREHSLEVELPFLQHYLGSFELVPIIVGAGDISQMSRALNKIIDSNTLIVVSSDLSQYLDYKSAVEKDKKTMGHILNLEGNKLEPGLNQACGLYPLKLLIETARNLNWQSQLIHYSNSGDTAGTKERVVGYSLIAFYGQDYGKKGEGTMENKQETDELTESQGKILLTLARQTIDEKAGQEVSGREKNMIEKALKNKAFQQEKGTFVTLTKRGRLRGCIGNINPRGSIAEGVRRNAVQAAFSDPRFPPLQPEELEDIEIEVSILTEPRQFDYQDESDLLDKLRPNVDGVIIRSGMTSATFLPQVWEKLPEPKEFLGNLCLKAGLPSDYWQTGKLKVQTYQVQDFSEESR